MGFHSKVEELLFRIKPFKPNLWTLLTGECSYYLVDSKEIFLTWHEQVPDHIAWDVLIEDVNHECLHAILAFLEDEDACRDFDNIDLAFLTINLKKEFDYYNGE